MAIETIRGITEAAKPTALVQTLSTADRTHATRTVAAMTDNSTGTVGTTIAAGAGVSQLSFSVNLADISATDVVLTFTPGYKFKVLAVDFVATKAASTAAKAATITGKVNGSAMTGGVISLTTAACTAGAKVAGTAVSAGNTGAANGTISLTASAVTAFVEGAGTFVVRLQNMDTADAIASLIDQVTKAAADCLDTATFVNAVADDLQAATICS